MHMTPRKEYASQATKKLGARRTSMKAIELIDQKGLDSLKLIETEKPQPGPNEILVEVKAAGVNFADVELAHGGYPPSKPLPSVIGFEVAGVVVDLGPDVKDLKLGDRVAAIVSGGGYAEYAVIDA